MFNNRCLIIAEAGVNHNGRLDLAYKLCDAAKDAGADVVKFQTWITEDIITQSVEQAGYQKENNGSNDTQFEMLKKLELPFGDFMKIKRYCDEIGITFLSTADERKSLDFLVSIGVPCLKVGSGDIGNISFLRYVGGKHLPVILSTGMASLSDVDISLQALRDGGATDITLLHCTTSYPCAFENVNLSAMATIRDAFKLPVGYSDHTLGSTVAVAAVAMGACIVEKHFTLDKRMDGPDHRASSTPDEFREYVKAIRGIGAAMGDGKKQPSDIEREISKVVLKRIVAKRPIRCGHIISEDDICVKRNNVGLMADKWDMAIGIKATKDYRVDDGIVLC